MSSSPASSASLSLLLLFFLSCLIHPAFCSKSRIQFNLIHGLSAAAPKTRSEQVTDLLHSDNHRKQVISQRRKMATTAGIIRISSGAYAGTGQYFVEFRVGSPSQKFHLVADTGSDLTWMNCQYRRECNNCGSRIGDRRIFHAHRSSSFKPIRCSTRMCQKLPFSLAQCRTPFSPCQYDYRYADGSTSHGIFANETVTVSLTNGRKMKLQHVTVGCSSSLIGSSFRASDGLLGLGYSNYSFVRRSMPKFGGKFSYCLVDHLSPKNVTSYLTFGGGGGEGSASTFTPMKYTELVLDVINGFYAVNVLGISINGVMLNIPMAIWNVSGEGGVIIDSGTSLTFLAEPAYQKLMPALKLPLMRFTKQVQVKSFDYCFSSVGFDEALVPKLVIHFTDSARFEPPIKSYVIDVSDEVKCLGFMPVAWPDVSIIGNIMQQNFLWEFDIVQKRLGFTPSACVTR